MAQQAEGSSILMRTRMAPMRSACAPQRERGFHSSIQPALAYEDASWLESSAKLPQPQRLI